MTSQGVVYVDETVDEYRKLRLPKNWTVHHEPEWGSLQASMQWCLRQFPDATRYGWLADDTVPRTKHWDRKLEAAAGDHGFAQAHDNWRSLSGTAEDLFVKGLDMSAGLCWGGNLVRAVGWWALPGVTQAGIDTAWCDIIHPLGVCRYLRDVVVEHRNWRTGLRPFDPVDSWERDGVDYISADLATKDRWVADGEHLRAVERVREAIRLSSNTQPA